MPESRVDVGGALTPCLELKGHFCCMMAAYRRIIPDILFTKLSSSSTPLLSTR